jgi:hypothetical protein
LINVVGLSILWEIKAPNGFYCDVRTLVLPGLHMIMIVIDLINRRFFNVYSMASIALSSEVLAKNSYTGLS